MSTFSPSWQVPPHPSRLWFKCYLLYWVFSLIHSSIHPTEWLNSRYWAGPRVEGSDEQVGVVRRPLRSVSLSRHLAYQGRSPRGNYCPDANWRLRRKGLGACTRQRSLTANCPRPAVIPTSLSCWTVMISSLSPVSFPVCECLSSKTQGLASSVLPSLIQGLVLNTVALPG